MLYINYIFYVLLFIGFFLPTNSNYYIPLPGILLALNELAFLLLPIVNIFCFSKSRFIIRDRRLRILIWIFIGIVLFTEFILKPLAFQQTFGEAFKSIRIGLPLISSLLILVIGLRPNVRIVWRTMLIAIGSSIFISLVALVVPLPIYYNIEEGVDVLAVNSGRIANSNAAFGLIGLYLLFRDRGRWYNSGSLVRSVSIASIASLILTFNRTYLALLVLAFIFLSYTTFSRRNFLKIIFYPLFFLFISVYSYSSSDEIARQIDRRILSILTEDTSLKESTIENNRDKIYDGIVERISQGYWMIGLPLKTPIFSTEKRGVYMELTVTDTSFVNILLRYGVLAAFLFIVILFRFNKIDSGNGFNMLLFLFVLASLNIDALFGHNSIFFLLLFFIVSNFNIYEGRIYSKNLFRY